MEGFVVLSLVALSLLISNASCFSTPGFCSGADISNERQVRPEELLDKIWNIHLVIDDRQVFDNNSKIIYTLGSRKTNLFAYQVGLSVSTRQCNTFLIQDAQLIRDRPCIFSKVLIPALKDEEPAEYVQTFLNGDKSQLLFYQCYNYDLRAQKCMAATVLGATTSTSFSSSDKAAFERKIKQLAGTEKLPGTLREDNPSSNDCEREIADALGIPREDKK